MNNEYDLTLTDLIGWLADAAVLVHYSTAESAKDETHYITDAIPLVSRALGGCPGMTALALRMVEQMCLSLDAVGDNDAEKLADRMGLFDGPLGDELLELSVMALEATTRLDKRFERSAVARMLICLWTHWCVAERYDC
ncbi:hypothetical protein LJC34_07180 [Oscillospiraceae bacterium OttesenSCG-928-G22]|nr:hypothetical protein [Oscillospiraceae bacterium OttesenSCG-928-G22]